MKKKQTGTMALWAASIALAGTLALPSMPALAKSTIKLGIGTAETEESLARSIGAMKRYVEMKSDGEIEVRLFWNTLGGSLQLSEQIKNGTLEVALTDDAVMVGFHKPIMALQIPYLFPSAPVAWEFMRDPVAAELAEGMRKETGIRTIAWSENGFRNITNNVRAIKSPDDMKGIKMRTMQSPVYIQLMRSMGAAATPIPAPELVLSLKQGVVDGQENASGTIVDYKLYEVQKFMSVNEHVYGFHMIIVNDAWFTKLPPGHQQILVDGAQLHAQTANSWRARGSLEALTLLRDKGVQIHMTSPEEKERFRAVTQKSVMEYIATQIGEDNVKKVVAGADAARKRVYGN